MLGLKRGIVKLVPHNPKWKELFEQEKKLLNKTFGKTIIAIEHIGSTAIPGLPAKPIIDMSVGVKSLAVARAMKRKFEKLGYRDRTHVPKNAKEIKWEELYIKGPESKVTHYIHAIVYGRRYWRDDLLFRDYLRENPARARQYLKLKKELAKKYSHNRRTYTMSKESFIKETLKEARKNPLKKKSFK